MCGEFRCVTLEFLVLFWYNLHLGSDHSLLSVLLCASGKYTLVKILFCTMRVQCFLAGVGAQGEKSHALASHVASGESMKLSVFQNGKHPRSKFK